MGRKPNAIISEFFERGRKLEDSTNRYEHTCKLCHEEFPKGRLDGLTNHLLKRCLALPQADRDRVLRELTEKPNQNGRFNPTAIAMRHQQSGSLSFLPPSHATAWQPNDLLGAQPSLSQSLSENPRKRKRGRASRAQQQYESEFQLVVKPRVVMPQEPTQEDMLHEIQQYTQSQATEHMGEDSLASQDAFSAHLALAASAANSMIPGAEMVDNALETPQVAAAPSGVVDRSTHPNADTNPPQRSQNIRNYTFQHIVPGADPQRPHAPYLQNFSVHEDGPKAKKQYSRRYTENRKREVKEVRKFGACLRCRMLKKPCSGGTPCSTCANVDQARHWKHPCMRTRIEDEFDLLAANVHFLLALNALGEVKERGFSQTSARVIEATSFPESEFGPACLKSVLAKDPERFKSASHCGDGCIKDTQAYIEFLDHDHINIGEILRSYLEAEAPKFCEREASRFMRETLLMASDVLRQRHDILLANAIDLWIVVHLLTDEDGTWHLHSTTAKDRDACKSSENSNARVEISPQQHIASYNLISLQLRGFVEKRAMMICRRLMREFERRLILRQQEQKYQFETFLTAILLMNCIEKLCWLFTTWAVTFEELNPSHPGLTSRGLWPLQKHPREYVETGERVVDIIAMLMKMREIAPPMTVDNYGTLHADLSRRYTTNSRFNTSGYTTAIVPDVDIGGKDDVDDTILIGDAPSCEGKVDAADGLDSFKHQDEPIVGSVIDSAMTDQDLLLPQQSQQAHQRFTPSKERKNGMTDMGNVVSDVDAERVANDGLLEASSSSREQLDEEDEALMIHLQRAAEEAAEGIDDFAQDESHEDEDEPYPTPPVVTWFHRVNLKVEDLQRARFDAPWDSKDSRCWELKYIGRMLLPDNAYALRE